VTEHTDTLVVGQYFLAVEGLAMIRNALTAPSTTWARVDEIRELVAKFDEFPQSMQIPMTRHEVEAGYTKWAPRYDGPNPAIELEQPIVHGMLASVPVGVALDAACGTGRHAAKLAELGHAVIGVDTTDAMLAVAREKVPAANFRIGRLEALPVDDASVDLITCTLALTHVEDLAPVMHEFARVLRPGGQVVLADIHPLTTLTGGIAGFPEDITRGIPYVVNLTHHVSEYVAAFLDARLAIVECLEPRVSETMLQVFPSYMFLPDATRQAFDDLPYLLIWRLERPASNPS
jgi:ubiquinone/menaquinone biosynthesis C-methylase UbiE